MIRIHRINADYHRSQRDATERQQVITGTLPEYQASTSYTNTPAASNLRTAVDRLHSERYQNRGGRLARGAHNVISHSTAPTPPTCAPVTHIESGSTAHYPAPITPSARRTVTTTNGSTTPITAQTHAQIVPQTTPHHTYHRLTLYHPHNHRTTHPPTTSKNQNMNTGKRAVKQPHKTSSLPQTIPTQS
jgi:hypothetical protein